MRETEAANAVATPGSPARSPFRGRVRGGLAASPPLGSRTSLAWVLALLVLALGIAVLVSISLGAVHVPLRAIAAAMLGRHPLTETQHTILFEIRLPRVLASALVGAGLAISGLMFQGLFRNPMADPYIIGASGGAAVGACVGIVFLAQFTAFGFSATALLAFAGAVAAMMVV